MVDVSSELLVLEEDLGSSVGCVHFQGGNLWEQLKIMRWNGVSKNYGIEWGVLQSA